MSVPCVSARPRWLLQAGVVAVAVLALAACSVEQTLPAPTCNGGSGLIVAQSVPTAQLIPCFAELPDGWSFETVKVNQDGTFIRLDSDRAGEAAATLRFTETCDIRAAAAQPSRFDDRQFFEMTERIEPSFRARSYIVFDGGCVTWRFDFDRGTSATESLGLEATLDFITRKALNDNIRETFIDEEI
jgi:hypothetical protein